MKTTFLNQYFRAPLLSLVTVILFVLSSCYGGNKPTQTAHDGLAPDSSNNKVDTSSTKPVPIKDNGNDTLKNNQSNK